MDSQWQSCITCLRFLSQHSVWKSQKKSHFLTECHAWKVLKRLEPLGQKHSKHHWSPNPDFDQYHGTICDLYFFLNHSVHLFETISDEDHSNICGHLGYCSIGFWLWLQNQSFGSRTRNCGLCCAFNFMFDYVGLLPMVGRTMGLIYPGGLFWP